jgi:hypothetical protein
MILGGLVMISIGLFIIIGTFKLFKPTDYSTWKETVGHHYINRADDDEYRSILYRIA